MDYSDFLGTRLGNKDRRKPFKPRRRKRRMLFNREAEQLQGGIGKGVNNTHRDKGVLGGLFGQNFGNKMRPKPSRRPRRKPLWFGRPRGIRYGSKYRENYSNFIGAEDSFLQKNKWLLLGGALVVFFGFTKQGKSMLKKITKK